MGKSRNGTTITTKAQIPQQLRVFAWNLRSLDTSFARSSLALNAIEKGRAWHWRLLPAGWVDPSFIFQHGQIKTKQAFAIFFRNSGRTLVRPPKRTTKVKPYLVPRLAPVRSKQILKVTHFADLIDAKISALSTRGFARDLLDLYSAHQQRTMDWRRLLIRASKNQLNDYNPVELEDRLRLLELEFRQGAQELPCERPPAVSALTSFIKELRTMNAEVARELTRSESDMEDDQE
jgi:hypothetical protein